MKKITLILLLMIIGSPLFSQTWTTDVVNLATGFTVKFDVTSTTVTMTMTGPDNRWLGVAISNTTYTPGGSMGQFVGDDVIVYTNNSIKDARMPSLNGFPIDDTSMDWTIAMGGNTTSGGTRTVIATRARDTGDANDYTFLTSPDTFNIIWALGDVNTQNTFAYHSGGRGAVLANTRLSNDEFELQNFDFTIAPNPSNDKLNINVKNQPTEEYNVEVFDLLGKKIYSSSSSLVQLSVNVNNWQDGIYMVRLSNTKGVETKRFVKY